MNTPCQQKSYDNKPEKKNETLYDRSLQGIIFIVGRAIHQCYNVGQHEKQNLVHRSSPITSGFSALVDIECINDNQIIQNTRGETVKHPDLKITIGDFSGDFIE